tara:strand:+ start:219 stop:347 length:129 start_codon:yes stop_codon:yes gene_type:complete
MMLDVRVLGFFGGFRALRAFGGFGRFDATFGALGSRRAPPSP